MRAPGFQISIALSGLCLLLHSPAGAQALQDDFWLQAGGYKAGVDTKIRVSPVSNPNAGTQLDLESDLNFDESEFLPFIYGGARVGGGFSLGLEYYSLKRDTTATLAREITVEDVTYPVNASVTAGFGTDIYRATIGWAFMRSEDFELGGAVGVHATKFRFSIEGQGNAGDLGLAVRRRQEDVLAPLPTVGLLSSFEAAPGFRLGGRIDYLSLSVGKYDGRLVNAQASAAYRFTRNLGIGVMYRYVNYRVDVEKHDYVGRFAYSFSGPAAFLEVGF